jgi:hypothetical protein
MLVRLSSLKRVIREEIGRSYKTLQNDPFSFKDFSDYNIEIYGDTINGFYLTIYCKNQKIFPTTFFKDRKDCEHTSRIVVDKHRVSLMNGENI